MRIDTMLARRGEPLFSFEFFPPQDDEGVRTLFDTIATLRDLTPDFVSVTYGAGGSKRTRTIQLVERIRTETGLEPMAHLTCTGATAGQLRETVTHIGRLGIENILALRGDPPADEGDCFRATEGGFSHATELAALITEIGGFCVGGACHPERHPESADDEEEIDAVRRKVESGVHFLITQLFLDNRSYLDFVARLRAAGIEVPVIPGIIPITSAAQLTRFTQRCGATIPTQLAEALEQRRDDREATIQLGVAWATLQCTELLQQGAPGIHFYTLNRSPATRAILSALRASRPWDRPAVPITNAASAGAG